MITLWKHIRLNVIHTFSGNFKWLLRGQNLTTLLHLMQMHKRRIEQSFYHYIAYTYFLSIDRIYENLKGFWWFCTKKVICLFFLFFLASNRKFWGRPDTIVVYCHFYALGLNQCRFLGFICTGTIHLRRQHVLGGRSVPMCPWSIPFIRILLECRW